MVETGGYSFFYESLHRLHINGVHIGEVPISLPARTYGHSKMRLADIVQSVAFLLILAIRTRTAKGGLIYAKPFTAPGKTAPGDASAEWDTYWEGRGHSGKWLYDLIAAFYRRFIIRPAVNYFLSKYFPNNAKVLHAGCGSGAVDNDMAKVLNITALDLSPAGLTEYKRYHPDHKNFILGSIFEIPVEAETFDGIFNLGVMEHFHDDEIGRILVEFHRVLKPGGHIIMFWPPAWGLTVNVLKATHFLLNRILRRNVKLHPDEHTHIISRNRTKEWLRQAGLELDQFYFGPRDLFTHQIIVAEKKGV
jgi:SAM-dependent methyltransferase